MVDRVMAEVDKIAEDLDHIPVAAFIFRENEADEVIYTVEKRLHTLLLTCEIKNVFFRNLVSPSLVEFFSN